MTNSGSPKPILDEDEQASALFWLRTTIVVCLFLASLSVLDAFITLLFYVAYLMGRMDPDHYKEWFLAFQEIQQSPFLFIGMNLYNIILWNGVIVGCIWLLRFHIWSRAMLKTLLGLDMIVTVLHVLWEAHQGSLTILNPGWFIVMNAIQVGAILVLSHPNIVRFLESLSQQQKQAVHSWKNSDL